jgi:hypothetical protein
MSELPVPFSYSAKLALLCRACADPRLLRTTLSILAVIVDAADKTTGATFIGVTKIIAASNVPKTTALRALKQLEMCGWLRIERRFGSSSNYYLSSPERGTSPGTGTSVVWNGTGAIQNLRKGSTSPGTGTGPVPTPGHYQVGKSYQGNIRYARARRPGHELSSPSIPRERLAEREADAVLAEAMAELGGEA